MAKVTTVVLGAGGGGGLSDGDYGDIVVSSSGTVISIDSAVATAAGRAIMDDATAVDQRTTLGLGTLATQNGTFSGMSSGTNTGDQTITLTSDVTGSGTGSFATTIAAGSVTPAKMDNGAAFSMLGRSANTSGVRADIAASASGHIFQRIGASVQSTPPMVLKAPTASYSVPANYGHVVPGPLVLADGVDINVGDGGELMVL